LFVPVRPALRLLPLDDEIDGGNDDDPDQDVHGKRHGSPPPSGFGPTIAENRKMEIPEPRQAAQDRLAREGRFVLYMKHPRNVHGP
jgi:hypothetical protein